MFAGCRRSVTLCYRSWDSCSSTRRVGPRRRSRPALIDLWAFTVTKAKPTRTEYYAADCKGVQDDPLVAGTSALQGSCIRQALRVPGEGNMTEEAMEEPVKLGQVIMTRVLERDGKDILVEIGLPVPFAEGETDCYVPFRIGDDNVHMAGGVDSVQAMIFALAMIGDLLKADGLDTFPGFPVTEPADKLYVCTYRQPTDVSLLEATV